MFGKRKIAAVAGEFLGTATLTFVVLAVSRSTIGIPYFVAIAAGLAVAVMGVSIATDVHLNPALTIGLWTARRIKTSQMVVYVAVQFVAAYAAYGLYRYFAHGTVQHVSNGFDGHILVAEAVGAFVFALVASAVLYDRVWGSRRAVVVGAGLVAGMIIASSASNGFINPAVALGSNSWGWGTYALGPVLGAIIGVNLYALVFSGMNPENAAAKAAVASSSSTTVSSGSKTTSKTKKSKK
ncbi:MAG TPA: aquaporin [Candidatus Saccharimonadales bacterium]|nr:aquaporin [Candidatus Saccharimonadales bacterium]